MVSPQNLDFLGWSVPHKPGAQFLAVLLGHMWVLGKVQPMAIRLRTLASANLRRIESVEVVGAAVIRPDWLDAITGHQGHYASA
jgi:hypothetical protein